MGLPTGKSVTNMMNSGVIGLLQRIRWVRPRLSVNSQPWSYWPRDQRSKQGLIAKTELVKTLIWQWMTSVGQPTKIRPSEEVICWARLTKVWARVGKLSVIILHLSLHPSLGCRMESPNKLCQCRTKSLWHTRTMTLHCTSSTPMLKCLETPELQKSWLVSQEVVKSYLYQLKVPTI